MTDDIYAKDPSVHVGTAIGWVLWNPLTGKVLDQGEFEEAKKEENKDD